MTKAELEAKSIRDVKFVVAPGVKPTEYQLNEVLQAYLDGKTTPMNKLGDSQ